MPYVDVGDAELAYEVAGSGPPLVLVHGWPLCGATWANVLPLLAPHFTCYVLDQAGAGATRTTPATDFDFAGQARRLGAFIEALGLAGCDVLAQDTGATIARHAVLTGARIGRLVLLNTEIPGHRPPWIELFQATMRLPGALASFRLLLRSRLFCRSALAFGGCFADPAHIDGAFRERQIVPLIEQAGRLEGVRSYLLGINWQIVDGLAEGHARIGIPVLFLWGEQDRTFPLEVARPMVAQLPDARLEVIPGAALLVHEEQPAAVAERTIAWLARPAAQSRA